MIPRDSAASIVAILEEALDYLLMARTRVDGASPQHPMAQLLDELWRPTAGIAGMLAVIGEAYPDLIGPDVAFREGPNVGRIRTDPTSI